MINRPHPRLAARTAGWELPAAYSTSVQPNVERHCTFALYPCDLVQRSACTLAAAASWRAAACGSLEEESTAAHSVQGLHLPVCKAAVVPTHPNAPTGVRIDPCGLSPAGTAPTYRKPSRSTSGSACDPSARHTRPASRRTAATAPAAGSSRYVSDASEAHGHSSQPTRPSRMAMCAATCCTLTHVGAAVGAVLGACKPSCGS
jgi:hypothetical protein